MLQIAHRSFMGISSWDSVLNSVSLELTVREPVETYLAMSIRPAGGSTAAMAGREEAHN